MWERSFILKTFYLILIANIMDNKKVVLNRFETIA